MRVENAYSNLARFTEEFRDETHLRNVLADLLNRRGAKGVRITHGRNERGKDIIFYMAGALSGDVLYACVVKNDRITGNAHSLSGAQTVLNQALQALSEPHIDRATGKEEKVHSVYIISPYDCTVDAIESIRVQLRENARRVEFLCGVDLLRLFQEHWPDFLRFESAVLTRYLRDLKEGLIVDTALISLLTRHNANAGLRPFESFYVPSGVEIRIDKFELPKTPVPLVGALLKHVTLAELEDTVTRLKFWKHALKIPEVIGQDASLVSGMAAFVDGLTHQYKTTWQNSLRFRQLRETEPALPEERRLDLSEAEVDLYDQVAGLLTNTHDRLVTLRRAARKLVRIGTDSPNPSVVLAHQDFVTLSASHDFVNAIPGLLKQERSLVVKLRSDDLLFSRRGVLLVGPPGSGKTSFCRWNTLRAIERFSRDPAEPLPVYVPAHRLASTTIGTFEEAFLGSVELESLDAGGRNSAGAPMLLFVDGLDEVPDREQQRLIITALQGGLQKYPSLSLIVTSRPYVWGAWLNWLPRLHMSELSVNDQRLLAERWLPDADHVQSFFDELQLSPALHKLMGIPLLATLILNLYKKSPIMPENKASLYRTFVELYCGGWDTAKGLAKAGKFRIEQKLRPLVGLAYTMHVGHLPDCQESQFVQAVKRTMPALVPAALDLLAETIQDGIIVRAGPDLLFAHLSFQEYLAAQYLASDPTGQRPNQVLRWYLRGEDWWKEVVHFYIVSRDDPSTVSDWIKRVAAEVRGSGDLAQRLEALVVTIQETFPGFVATFARPSS